MAPKLVGGSAVLALGAVLPPAAAAISCAVVMTALALSMTMSDDPGPASAHHASGG